MSTKLTTQQKSNVILPSGLLEDIKKIIDQTKTSIASTINTGLTLLYWRIGSRISKEILQQGRAEYGKEIVLTLSRQLTLEYDKGFSEKRLRLMIQFSEVFSNEKIIMHLVQRLSWSHFIELIPIKYPIKRNFYAEMCRVENWSVRTLRNKIDSMLFERTALSKKPESLAQYEIDTLRKEDKLTPNLVFRDPYVLDFLNLNDRYIEKDLEDAIMREVERFLLELGIGFCFVARQKRLIIDNKDFYLDLLFFHRKLNRLIAIELKIGDFKPEHKGQMELYLRWLDKYERQSKEFSPLGLILCAGKQEEQIELLELNQVGIHVAEYITELPSKEVLREKLQRAIKYARKRLENKEKDK